jgi:hypothetical protein
MMAVLTAVVLAAIPIPAQSKSALRFAEARKAALNLEYDRALSLAHAALEQGDADAALTFRLFVFQAEMSMAVDLEDSAVAAFARALELEPNFELDLEASPRLERPFKKAKARMQGVRLSAVPTSIRAPNGTVSTQVRLVGDTLQLVVGATLQPFSGAPVPLTRTDGFEGRWSCERAPCPHLLSFKDNRGNELLRVGSQESPLFVREPEGPKIQEDRRPWYRRGWPYLIASGVFAAAGTVMAVRTAQADADFRNARDNPGQFMLEEVQAKDGQRHALYAVTATFFGLSLGSGVISWLWWSP